LVSRPNQINYAVSGGQGQFAMEDAKSAKIIIIIIILMQVLDT
jgi:hypothetical protein